MWDIYYCSFLSLFPFVLYLCIEEWISTKSSMYKGMYFADGAGSKRMTSVIFQLYFNLSIIHVSHVLNIISNNILYSVYYS